MPAKRSPVAPVALAYSGTTGGQSRVMPGYGDDEVADLETYDGTIDEVVARVHESFERTASADDLVALERDRPSIPRDVDRALLVDVSDALGMPDLTDRIRFRIRNRFWAHLDDE